MTQTHFPTQGQDGPHDQEQASGTPEHGGAPSSDRAHDSSGYPQAGYPQAGYSEPTAPLWYGEPSSTGYPQQPGTPHPQGDPAAYGSPTTGLPAGPPPPPITWAGAEPAQPAQPRRRAELTTVALLAAVLASGGTYAATQLGSNSTQASSPASSSSSLGRGTDAGPVTQADASAPNWTATAAAVAPSVVSISVTSQAGSGQGSGVVIDKAGHILTNNHVVTGAGGDAAISVTLSDGRAYDATVAGTDPSTDLAVITLKSPPSNLTPIALGDSEAIKVGDPVMAVGNPLGLAGTVTTGIVSALNRPVQTSDASQGQGQGSDPFGGQGQSQTTSEPVVTNAIQTSAAINPGNSGGALVNASGQLVGINSAIASLGSSGSSQSGSIGIGFAIPVNEAKSIAGQLIDKGSADHAYLGVSTKDGSATDGTAKRAGAQIAAVEQGTPASGAGLRVGDTVIAIDGERVESSTSLVAYVREHAVGDKVKLTVLRDGKEQEITATLAVRPAASK